MGAAIVLEGMTKRYGRRVGVEDLSFEVPAGEVFGYLGPNGAGKTTTIRVLMDLIRATSGRATVLGLDSRADAVAIRARTGYLPGDLSLYGDLTGHELLAAFASLRGGVDARRRSSITSRIGVPLDRRIRDLSHGNARKLGLAQALMHDPELLLLDEPSEGLDPLVQQELHALIDEARADGTTVFLSSHNLPEVQRICDRVAIIRGGRLVAVEDVRDLLRRAYREIELRFRSPVEAAPFTGLPGVLEARAVGETLHVRVEGSVDPVLKRAAEHEVLDIATTEPNLEDVFLAYYGGDDAP